MRFSVRGWHARRGEASSIPGQGMVTAGLRRVLAQLARSGKLGRHLSSVMDSVSRQACEASVSRSLDARARGM